MLLAQTITDLPTTFGGVAILALALIVWNFFTDRTKNARDVSKTKNLQDQTTLLEQQRDLMTKLVEQGKKDSKSAKKSRQLLKQVNQTVVEIRKDQIAKGSP